MAVIVVNKTRVEQYRKTKDFISVYWLIRFVADLGLKPRHANQESQDEKPLKAARREIIRQFK